MIMNLLIDSLIVFGGVCTLCFVVVSFVMWLYDIKGL